MTTRARTLDVIITGITPNRVYYGFPVGEACIQYADMYKEGNFDLSKIEVGKRYVIETAEVPCLVLDHRKQQASYRLRYVWIKAKEVQPNSQLAARTAKQRKASEDLAAKPLADNGELFKW